MNNRYAYVVAHFHASGLLGVSTRNLLDYLRGQNGRVVLVSTGLGSDEALTVPPGVEVIVRENIGYDFYSYKIGMESITDPENYDAIFVLNTSFVCLDPKKLMVRALLELTETTDVLGISYSKENSPHLQSYFLAFSRRVVLSPSFRDWWHAVEPISDKKTVIEKYEIGLSTFLFASGYRVKHAFAPSARTRLHTLCDAIRIGWYQPDPPRDHEVTLDLRLADYFNPSHFAWAELLQQFGIVKRELFEKNPARLDLQPLFEVYGKQLETL